MSRSNFVGAKLISIKDKLSSAQKAQDETAQVIQPSTEMEANTETGEKIPTQEVLFSQESLESVEEPSPEISMELKTKSEMPVREEEKREKPDKYLLKALKGKKAEYLRTKDVVLRSVNETLSEVTKASKELESRRDVFLTSLDKLQSSINEIDAIDESKWNEYDFSIELSDANKLVEHARIENIICKDKFKIPEKVLNELVTPTPLSATDIFSSTFSQLFKFGFKLFLPLIIGVIFAAMIISLTILVAMGTL